MTMFTQYGPRAEEGWPDGAREAYAQRCLAQLAEHAPNVTDAVLDFEVLAPPDLERIFGLEGGSIFQGEQDLAQMAFMRPCPELARYATPVDGLYLCGAGTHPGGGVIAAAGHNAAHRVLRDLRSARRRRRLRVPGGALGHRGQPVPGAWSTPERMQRLRVDSEVCPGARSARLERAFRPPGRPGARTTRRASPAARPRGRDRGGAGRRGRRGRLREHDHARRGLGRRGRRRQGPARRPHRRRPGRRGPASRSRAATTR